MDDCIFCRIAEGKIESDKVYEDEKFVAFRDINPQAPTHVLIIPKQHIATLNELEDSEMAGRLVLIAKELALKSGISESGYRIVLNCNRDAGQDVFHIHCHLLGGRKFNWPPG